MTDVATFPVFDLRTLAGLFPAPRAVTSDRPAVLGPVVGAQPVSTFTGEGTHEVSASTAGTKPIRLILRYSAAAVRRAIVAQMEDGAWLATIPELPGVWACEESAVEALDVLKEVVYEWALLKVEDSDRDLPVLGDIDLNLL